MVDCSKYLILLNGEIRTPQIESCVYNSKSDRYDVRFLSQKQTYSYSPKNITILQCPEQLQGEYCQFTANDELLYNVEAVYVFRKLFPDFVNAYPKIPRRIEERYADVAS